MTSRHRAHAAVVLSVMVASLSGPGSPRPTAPDRVPVPKALIGFDDGDSITIAWPDRPAEAVRILGIDTPEVLHLDHGIPYAQPFGDVAAGFLRGAVAVAKQVELLRSGETDPFGRTLGYVYLDGQSYSVLVLEARLAVETVTRYGDNGLPAQARECVEAGRGAGPVPFEDPHLYRRRMRVVTRWMKARGVYPKAERDG